MDYKEKGWFIPNVKDTVQVDEIKQGILNFVRKQHPDAAETFLEEIQFTDKGKSSEIAVATVGTKLCIKNRFENFGEIWTILCAHNKQLYLIVCTERGAKRDTPVWVGTDEIVFKK